MIYNVKEVGKNICDLIKSHLYYNNNDLTCFSNFNNSHLSNLLKYYYIANINKLNTYEIAAFSNEYMLTIDDQYYNLNDFKLVYIIDHNSLSIGCNGTIFLKVIRHNKDFENYELEFRSKLFI